MSALRGRASWLLVALTLLAGLAGRIGNAQAANYIYPEIESISPTTANVQGGVTITLQGENFSAGDTLWFDPTQNGSSGVQATINPESVVHLGGNRYQMTATIPPDPDSHTARAQDPFDLHLRLPSTSPYYADHPAPSVADYFGPNPGSNYAVKFITFNYTGAWPSAPTLTSLNPAQDLPTGGAQVTIRGTGFVCQPTVVFGLPNGNGEINNPSVANNGTTLTVDAPDDHTASTFPDRVAVHVHTCGGDSRTANFTYAYTGGRGPKIFDIEPGTIAVGGTSITITGTNLEVTKQTPDVYFTYTTPKQVEQADLATNSLEKVCDQVLTATQTATGAVTRASAGSLTVTSPNLDAGPCPAAVPKSVQITVVTGAGQDTYSKVQATDDGCQQPDLNPIHPVRAMLNSLFAIPSCKIAQSGFVAWLLAEPDVAGNLGPGAERRNPTEVAQLETVSAGVALGLLGLVFTISVLRFTVGGIANASPGTVVQGIVQPAGAALMVLVWPTLYSAAAVIADNITNALVGSVNGPALVYVLLASVFTLAGGVAAFLGGLGLIIGILFVLAGVTMFFALVALKLTLFALMTVLYVGMPLVVVASRMPTLEWLFTAAMRAWGVGLLWPMGWAVIMACAGGIGMDGFNLSQGGNLVTLVGHQLVSVILLVACVKMPGMMMRAALHGTGAGGRGRGLAGMLVLNHFISNGLAALGASRGVSPQLTGLSDARAAALGIKVPQRGSGLSSGAGTATATGISTTTTSPPASAAPASAFQLFDAEAFSLRHSSDRGRDVSPSAVAQAFRVLHDSGLAADVYDQSFEKSSHGNEKAHFVLAGAFADEWGKPDHGSQAKRDALVQLGAAPLENLRDGYELYRADPSPARASSSGRSRAGTPVPSLTLTPRHTLSSTNGRSAHKPPSLPPTITKP